MLVGDRREAGVVLNRRVPLFVGGTAWIVSENVCDRSVEGNDPPVKQFLRQSDERAPPPPAGTSSPIASGNASPLAMTSGAPG
jgi:hypothetical protein